MVIGVVGEHVEHGPPEQLVNFRLGNLQFPAGTEKVLVAVRIRIHGGQGLHEAFLPVLAIKAPREEVPGAFHLNQATVHHGDAASTGHLEVCHLCL